MEGEVLDPRQPADPLDAMLDGHRIAPVEGEDVVVGHGLSADHGQGGRVERDQLGLLLRDGRASPAGLGGGEGDRHEVLADP